MFYVLSYFTFKLRFSFVFDSIFFFFLRCALPTLMLYSFHWLFTFLPTHSICTFFTMPFNIQCTLEEHFHSQTAYKLCYYWQKKGIKRKITTLCVERSKNKKTKKKRRETKKQKSALVKWKKTILNILFNSIHCWMYHCTITFLYFVHATLSLISFDSCILIQIHMRHKKYY